MDIRLYKYTNMNQIQAVVRMEQRPEACNFIKKETLVRVFSCEFLFLQIFICKLCKQTLNECCLIHVEYLHLHSNVFI